MKFLLYYLEAHSDVEFWETVEGVELDHIESDGWGEFIHKVDFEADSIEEAKKLAVELYDGSSGVFNVNHNGKLAFTEETC